MENRKKKVLSGIMLMALVMVSQKSYAGLGDKFYQYTGSESAYANGFYIILSVIAVGVIGKICQHYFMSEEDKTASAVKINNHRHHRPKHIIKKTS